MNYDLIVIGSGPAGLIAAVNASRRGNKVLILEKLEKPSLKLKATGGGRCNLSNTLSNEDFIDKFGRSGRFMSRALDIFDNSDLIEFFDSINVQISILDGFRVFPKSHSSSSVLNGFFDEIERLKIDFKLSHKVDKLVVLDSTIQEVQTNRGNFQSKNILIATGGCGYSSLGGDINGYKFIEDIGHRVTNLYPAMIPLRVKESWTNNCRADTISKATIKIDIKKYSHLKAVGDLIFTNSGLRGPIILDFSREVTPLFDKFDEVPILINLTKGLNENEILNSIKSSFLNNSKTTILDNIKTLVPHSLAIELLKLSNIDISEKFNKLNGMSKEKLIKYLAWTPLRVIGCDGFDKAMVTRGGVNLKEIDSKTLRSKLYSNLYFAGEVLDLDGPCGGYNLRWAFASGNLVANSI